MLRLIHEHADAVPVGIRASGAPLARWTSASRGPVRRGSLISKTANWFVQFSPLYDCTGVGRPRLDPKRGGPPSHRGKPSRRSLFRPASPVYRWTSNAALCRTVRARRSSVRQIPRYESLFTEVLARRALDGMDRRQGD